ncbi:orotidine-5'-phosphate decarboxylase [Pseudodesulfovibrio senegalensis]|uniref:Orotidine 5'-phosphate decarboxylase n=1 Tax=Pseudodesulfovibrio senegalensis TaxID=1721087 RepID=A0A6N6N6D7_9BACT|nr:orotidine-5'-phosphate decarboxylase [Pseudodesulfovibrio senegalensis]KAB1443308.1 orotidine-5'-phosphate decarboxylase [Pseudodesulfovibrio senegalensis]
MAELVVALDYQDAGAALGMARKLEGLVPWAKVGMELFTAEGPAIVESLKKMEFKVFLDLKFHDIPNTVKGAVRSATHMGVDMVNIHALGGRRMAEGALEGRDMGLASGQVPPIVLAVTVLTSVGPDDLPLKNAPEPGVLALDLAVKAKQYGLNGVVCSALEARGIKASCGTGFSCLTPGIRPAAMAGDDQRRVVTPAQAVRNGSDYLVVGRPVTGATDPCAAARDIMDEMALALS